MAVNHRTCSLVSRLVALGCPYLQGMDGSVVERVVLTPGEARIRVLCWLVDRFQTDLQVDHENTSVSMDTDSLTGLLSNIGVCTKDNLALVQGHTSLQQQLPFLESLLDMVEIGISKESLSQVECSCRFADAICSSENLDASIFPRALNLFPADISLPGHSTMSRSSKQVSLEELGQEAKRLAAVMKGRQAELQSLMQQHEYEEINDTALYGCVKSLVVSVGTLAQLVVNFCQSYETELQPWVGHREPPKLGPLGPLCKRTATHWNHVYKNVSGSSPTRGSSFFFENDCLGTLAESVLKERNKILHSLQQLEATLERISALRGMPIKPESVSLYPTCHRAQETLQTCMEMAADLMPA